MTRTLAIVAIAVALLFSPVAEAHPNGGGWYQGGIGSSHRGGHYRNPSTGDHYRHR